MNGNWWKIAGWILILVACQTPTQTEAETEHSDAITELAEPETESRIPSFEMVNAAGETLNLKSFEGKKIFLNLWATWCGPCVAEMPSIQALYRQADRENTEFVLLSLDDRFETATQWMKQKNYEMPVYHAKSGKLPPLFQVQGIPTTFIFDENGQITFRHVGMENYAQEKFQEMLRSAR